MGKRFAMVFVLAAGCTPTETATVQLSMARATTKSAAAFGNCPPGNTCIAPTDLGVKITTAYLAEDIDAHGTNIGHTQAIYASPNCETFDSGGNAEPNLGSCGLDVGMTSSADQRITRGPDYIDLTAGNEAVRAALDAGRFAVDVGSYRYLRLDIGSNAVGAPPSGSTQTLPPGTAMNYRFRAGEMTESHEMRMLMGIDVVFDPPLELTAEMSVRVELDYNIDDVILERTGGDAPNCAAVGDTRYCLDASRIGFVPRIVIE
jgi:hypothetical protein